MRVSEISETPINNLFPLKFCHDRSTYCVGNLLVSELAILKLSYASGHMMTVLVSICC